MPFFKVFEKNYCSSYNNNTSPKTLLDSRFLVAATKQKSAETVQPAQKNQFC